MAIKALIFDYYGVIKNGDGNQYGQDVELLELIKTLSKNYTVALMTNANSSSLMPTLKSSGVAKIFAQLFISSDIGAIKPDPEAYKFVVEALELSPEETLLIDDLPENTEGAKNFGMQAILYKDLEQLKADLGKIGVEL